MMKLKKVAQLTADCEKIITEQILFLTFERAIVIYIIELLTHHRPLRDFFYFE